MYVYISGYVRTAPYYAKRSKSRLMESLGLSSGNSMSRVLMKSDMVSALGVVTLGMPTR